MIHIERILVPTDFSVCADTALAVARTVQRQFDAALHVLHLVESPVFGLSEVQTTDDSGDLLDLKEHLAEWAEAPASATTTEKAPVSALKPAWSVVDGTLEYVEDHDIDLVVIGTHGRKGTERFLLGSVAERVVRMAPCPVLTVQRSTEEIYAGGLKRILVPVDFSETTQMVVDHGYAVAARWNAEADLVFVVEEPHMPGFFRVDEFRANLPQVAADALSELEKLRAQGVASGVEVRNMVLTGEAADSIVTYAASQKCDLIVMATSGSTGLRRFVLGSVAEEVVRTAPCPVLTLKAGTKPLVTSEDE